MNSSLNSPWPALANHLWQSTVFAALVALVALLLRRNAARVRYGLWLTASIKFLLPFSLLVSLGGLLPKSQRIAPQAEAAKVYTVAETVAAPFVIQPEKRAAQDPVKRHIAEDMVPNPVPSLSPEAPEPMAALVGTPAPKMSWRERMGVWLAAVWLTGMTLVLLIWLRRWRQVSTLRRRAVAATDGRELAFVRTMDARLPLLLSQETMEPGVFGIFRQVLIWPERLSARLEAEHIEAILAHELEHVRRRDNLTAALHMLVEVLFWFHPIVWWMERRLVEERERACDEAVIARDGSAETYAEGLLRACRFCVESPLVCVAGITGADLSKRIRSIMTLQLQRLSWTRRAMLGMAAAMVIAAPLLLGQMRASLRTSALMQTSPAKSLAAMLAPARAVIDAVMDKGAEPIQGAAVAQRAIVAPFEIVSLHPSVRDNGGCGFGILPMSERLRSARPKLKLVTLPVPNCDPNVPTCCLPPPPSLTPLPPLPPGTMSVFPEGLLRVAYGVQDDRIVGAPDWVRSESYDLKTRATAVADADDLARVAGDPVLLAEQHAVFEPFLAEHFRLKAHRETRRQTVYALEVAPGGTKLAASRATSTTSREEGGAIVGQRFSMVELVQVLSARQGWTVLDRTGLTGRYDFKLSKTVEDRDTGLQGQSAVIQANRLQQRLAINVPLQRELGLREVVVTAPVEVVVIDSIAWPAPFDKGLASSGPGAAAAKVVPAGSNLGTTITSDTQGVDFNSYMKELHDEIQQNWLSRLPADAASSRDLTGMTGISFTILPDDRIGKIILEKKSGDNGLDKAAFAAIADLGKLPALPKGFHGPELMLRVGFYANIDPASGDERDSFRESFWQQRNPGQASSGNEALDEHYRRVDYANQHFGTANQAGSKTDRGMIYIKYGKPDSIDSHPYSYGFPAGKDGRQTVSYAFEVWHYRYIPGVGDEIDIEFVDRCQCGRYDAELERGRGGDFVMEEQGNVEQFIAKMASHAPDTVPWGKLQQLNIDLPRAKQSDEIRALHGRVVTITGYMVPLQEGTKPIDEFILIPYPGGTIHDPPPPANRMVYVRLKADISTDTKLAIDVTGELSINEVRSPYGDVSYTMMDATAVTHRVLGGLPVPSCDPNKRECGLPQGLPNQNNVPHTLPVPSCNPKDPQCRLQN